MDGKPDVTELRLVVTAPDYEEALRFYRDVLGLTEQAAFSSPGGRVTILQAGRATLELAGPRHAAYIDEVEVGRRGGHRRPDADPVAIAQLPPDGSRRPPAHPLLGPARQRRDAARAAAPSR